MQRNDKEQSSVNEHLSEVPVEHKQTKEFGSLPIIGKAQRSVYSFMLTMKMEQQLEIIQFSSTMYSKGSTSKPITVREPFFVGPHPRSSAQRRGSWVPLSGFALRAQPGYTQDPRRFAPLKR
jgi:hypothetical protein